MTSLSNNKEGVKYHICQKMYSNLVLVILRLQSPRKNNNRNTKSKAQSYNNK